MNENINLTKILKNCPKGFEFYSSVYGKLFYSHMYVSSSASKIYFTHPNRRSMMDDTLITIDYSWDGRLSYGEGECTLFPSKDQRDWSKFSAPWYKKGKFDPKTLNPFDRILVRNHNDETWSCNFFSHIREMGVYKFTTITSSYKQCVPYNDNTKHLARTTNKAPEYYRNWEE